MNEEINNRVDNVPHKLNLFKGESKERDAKLVYFNNKLCSETPEITKFKPYTMPAYCKRILGI